MEEKAISVILVDDNQDVMGIIEDLLDDHHEIDIVGYTSNADSFKSLVREKEPDVALIDIYFGSDDDGIGLLEWMRSDYPGVKPIMLSAYDDKVSECFLKGARGFSKKGDWKSLVPAIIDVHQGKTVIPESVSGLFVSQFAESYKMSQLISELGKFTDREMDVLRLMAGGLSRDQIMDKRNISRFTVKRHSQNICRKCGGVKMEEVITRYKIVL